MIDPNNTNTIRVGELPSEPFNLTDNIPHEVGTDLKRGTVQQLADFIASIIEVTGGVGFRAVSVTDGQTLPTTTEQEFILVGKGTYFNVAGGDTIVLTEELNALVSNGSFWFVGVEIPINVELAGITQEVREGFLNTTPSEDAVFKFIQDLDLTDKENTSNKQNSLVVDGTGVKFPTVDAVNAGLDLKADELNPNFTGTSTTSDGSNVYNFSLLPIRNNLGGFFNQPFFQSDKGYSVFQPLENNTPARFYIMPKGTPTGTTSKFEMFNNDYATDFTVYQGFNILMNNTTNQIDIGGNRGSGGGTRQKLRIGGDYVGSGFVSTASAIDFNTDNTLNLNPFNGAVTFGTSNSDPYTLGLSNQYTFRNPATGQATRVNINGNGSSAGALYFGRDGVRVANLGMSGATNVFDVSLNATNTGNALTTYMKILGETGNVLLWNGGSFTDNERGRLQVNGQITALAGTFPNQVVVNSQLDLKANIASPALTGTPTAPTATAGTNTTQIANTVFVNSAITTADSGNVKTTGNQTVAGRKSMFSSNATLSGLSLTNTRTTNTGGTSDSAIIEIQNSGTTGINISSTAGTAISASSNIGTIYSASKTGSAIGLNINDFDASGTGDVINYQRSGSGQLYRVLSTGQTIGQNATALNHLVTKAQTLYTNQTINANKTVTIAEFVNNNELILSVDATSGNITITLPTFTALQGYKVTVKKMDSSANSVTITGVGAINIDGSSSLVVSGQYSKATVGANLSQYIIL